MSAERLSRRRALVAALGAAGAAACHPLVQSAAFMPSGFLGPRLESDVLIAVDGARLPMRVWAAHDAEGKAIAPWAVIVGLHGMNDHNAAFGLAGPYWAARGVSTYAYDQRGFGSAPQRGIWGGEALMVQDLRTATALVRRRHPEAIIAVVGESMGGAVGILAFAGLAPPDADRLVLASPAVWGWRDQGLPSSMALWVAAHLAPSSSITAPNWLARRIRASDNIAELRRMGRDPGMIFATRIDTLYGLVDLMQDAQDRIGQVRAPMLFQYGEHDQIIPRSAARHAAARLPPSGRSAFYPQGWHLLLRDLQRQKVLDDTLAFIRDPSAPLPSGAPPIPLHPLRRKVSRAAVAVG